MSRNLLRKTKRDNISLLFIKFAISHGRSTRSRLSPRSVLLLRRGVHRTPAPLPYGYNISWQFGYSLYMRRRHRNVTEGNTSHAKRTSRCQALHGTKSCFVSTKSNALPYEWLIYIYQICTGGRVNLFSSKFMG